MSDTRIRISAEINGLAGIENLKGAFRGLQSAIGPTDQILSQARAKVLEFAKAGATTDAVLRGTVDALRGLASQADRSGKVYKTLIDDVASFEQKLSNATREINAQKAALQGLSSVGDFRGDPNRSRAAPGVRTVQDTIAAEKDAEIQFSRILDGLTSQLDQGRQRLLTQEEKYNQQLLQIEEEQFQKELALWKESARLELQIFDDKLNALNQASQRNIQLKGALGISGREVSPLYQSILDLGAARTTAAGSFMQKPPAEVLRDISNTFNGTLDNTRSGPIPDLENFSKKSTLELNSAKAALQQFRAELSPLSVDFQQLERTAVRSLRNIDKELDRRSLNGGLVGKIGYIGQGIGAAASAGIFGGPEGAIGGIGGGAIGAALGGPAGFAAGSFIGSSVGAYAGMGRQQLNTFTTYAADIAKQEIALKGVTKSLAEYEKALAAISLVSRDFNVPQQEATQGFTQLSASVIGAGGKVADAEVVFRNVTAAIKASGGSAQDVQGALTALSQVFSKGKVSAEELQGQLGERLPGAVTLFAKATGRTLPQLQKDLEQGVVGLSDLMKFVTSSEGLGQFELRAKKIADSSADAGARLTVTWNNTKRAIGEALQPLGAEIQDSLGKLLRDITPQLIALARGLGTAIKFLIDNAGAIGNIVKFAATMGIVNTVLKALPPTVAGARAAMAALSVQFGASSAAAVVASTRLAALRASLVSLGRLGVITVGISILTNNSAGRIDELRKRIRALRNEDAGEFGRNIGGSALSKQEIDAQLQQNRAERKRREQQLANIRLPLLPQGGVPSAVARFLTPQDEIANAAIKQLDKRYNELLALREKAMYGSPSDRATADLSKYTQYETPAGKEGKSAKERQSEEEKLAETLRRQQVDYENDLFNIRLNAERRLADFREQSLERAKELERSMADQRLELERSTDEKRRRALGLLEDAMLSSQIAEFRAGGIDTSLLEQQLEFNRERRQIADEIRKNDQDASDRRIALDRSVEAYKLNVAEGIRKIQLDTAQQVADRQRKGAQDAAEALSRATKAAGAVSAGGVANMLPGTRGGPNINEGVGYGRGRLHAGQDLGLDVGDPIHSRRAGRVVRAYSRGFGRVGGAVVVRYDNGTEGTYGHTLPRVGVGESVAAGQRIATVAPDGQNTHLHYELRDAAGKLLNPLNAIRESLRVAAGRVQQTPATASNSIRALPAAPPAALRPAAPMQPLNPASTQVVGMDGINQNRDKLLKASEDDRLAGRLLIDSNALTARREAFSSITSEMDSQTLAVKQQLEDYTRIIELHRGGMKPELAQQRVQLERAARSVSDRLEGELAIVKVKLQDKDLSAGARQEFEKLQQDLQYRLSMQGQIVEAVSKERELNDKIQQQLENHRQLVEGIAGGIGNGLGSALNLLVEGTESWGNSLRTIASTVLKDIAQQIAQITLVNPAVSGLKSLLPQLLGFLAPGGGATGLGASSAGLSLFDSAKGVDFDFARSLPPLKAYASGGIASSPQLALFGEGRMPEAFVPLPDGRRIPVTMKGTPGDGSTNVVVNVDATGTNVQGDQPQGRELGRVIAAAVQAEIVKQKRPGGVLAR